VNLLDYIHIMPACDSKLSYILTLSCSWQHCQLNISH